MTVIYVLAELTFYVQGSLTLNFLCSGKVGRMTLNVLEKMTIQVLGRMTLSSEKETPCVQERLNLEKPK